MVFGRTRVTNVLSEFCCLKCLYSSDSDSWHSILNVRKIFVANGDSYIISFAPFSYEYFILHIYSLSLKCRRGTIWLCRSVCCVCCVANKNYHWYMIAKFSGPFYLQFAVVFIFKVDCAKCHRGLSKKRFQDIYNQPDAQKHAVITFSRPGQGFWVYGIPGHFNSGIWYFLVKIRV